MRALNRALLRDFSRLRAQVLTLSLVVAAGTTVFVAMKLTVDSLDGARDTYFRSQRLADLFCSLKRAPRGLLGDLAAISGVARVEGRVAGDAQVFVGDRTQPARVRLVSIDPHERAPLDAIRVRSGRLPDPERDDELVLNEPFAEANHVVPGDHVRAVLNGRLRSLRVVGIGISPEFVFHLPPGVISPNDERYGVAWMLRAPLEAAFDVRGAFNDLVVQLAPGAVRGDVIAAIDRRFDGFGGRGAYTRADQLSTKMLDVRIQRLRGMLAFLPTLFLAVAAFVLNVVLGRLVQGQREQLGVLKAFGYSDERLALHYLGLAALIVIPGLVAGVVFGLELGHGLVRVFTHYFRLPLPPGEIDWAAVIGATTFVAFAGVLGAAQAVRRVTALHPVEAMRAPAPPSFRAGLVERMRLVRRLPAVMLMTLRNLRLAPGRVVASTATLALATALCVSGSFMGGSLDALVHHQFDTAMREDLSVAMLRPLDPAVCHSLAALDGVIACEPTLVTPVRVRFGGRDRQVALTSPTEGARLRRIIDRSGAQVFVPSQGLLVGQRLLDRLGAAVGDALEVETIEGRPQRKSVPVTAAIDDELGLNVYASVKTATGIFGETPAMAAALLRIAPGVEESLVARLSQMPLVIGVTSRSNAIADFEKTASASLRTMNLVLALLSAVLAIAVVYNGARVALAERARDLASLRVLGFTRNEVWRVLLGETVVTNGLGVPIGLVLGHWLAGLMATSLSADEFRIPFVIAPVTYVFATVVVVGAALLSALQMRLLINRLDLVEVLKTRE